ncbi:efflux RND transporter periplasmic adaptor subunit [Marinobacteraceae bacterium S3BR75-40.1]
MYIALERHIPGAARKLPLPGLASLIMLALLAGCGESEKAVSENAQPAMPVVVQKLEAVDHYTVDREFSGRIESTRQSALAFEFSGRVESVTVDEGDRVSRGQLLARLDTDLLQAEQRQADAALAQRRSQLALARQTLKRFKRLLQDNAVSRQEVDEAQEKVHSLEAGVDLEKARLQTITTRLEKARLTAPFNAVVARRSVDEGAVVGPQQPVLQLLESGPQEARIAVTAGVADRFDVGETLALTVRGQQLQSHIKRILPVRDVRTHTVDLIVAIDAPETPLRPGDLVSAQVPETIENRGYWLPYSALTDATRGLWGVYSVVSDDQGQEQVALRTVEVLHQTGDRVFVRGTLEDGDRVVAKGTHRMVPGLAVDVQDARPALAVRTPQP